MKQFTIFLFVGLLSLIFFITHVSAQTHWTKYPGNPVFVEGPSGSWDAAWVSWPFVIHDGTHFIMYYTGYPSISPIGAQIGRATSLDGITWDRHDNPVIVVGDPGDWDSSSVMSGPVIFDGSEYKMWYTGDNGTTYKIGLATSSDGIIWTPYEGNPVFLAGDSGGWDDSHVAAASVIFHESVYKMWYVGRENSTGIWRVGYATSPDGIIWDRYADNPVLDVGETGEWDDEDIKQSYVLYNGNQFEMWYQGSKGSYTRSGYATSPDGIEWTKYTENPILVTAGGWETRVAGITSVIFQDSEYRAWYIGETSSKGRIGYATSPLVLNVPDPIETIQAAIDSAVDGNLVLVDEGTYYENISFKGKAITVASRFYVDGDTSHISKTIIDGSQHTNPDSGSVVYFVSSEDTNSVLCGFTITGGSGTKAYWADDIHWYGGGVFCASGGRIINNIIRDNAIDVDVVYASGGGILAGWWGTEYVFIYENTILLNSVNNNQAAGGGISFYCDGKITNNVVVGNAVTATDSWGMGGGITCLGPNPLFISVDIDGNYIENNQVNATGNLDPKGFAGGLQYARVNGLISNNTIHNNKIQSAGDAYGGGIFINTCEKSAVANNLISHNSVDGSGDYVRGGGLNYSSENVIGKTSIYNNIIVYNEAIDGNGGGISCGFGLNNDALIINNTIAFNKAGLSGGGVAAFDYPTGVMFNSILWGNEASNNSQIYPGTGSTLNVLFSDIQGGYSGEGNIDHDPYFADSLLNLSDTSYCVGNGTDSVEVDGNWYECPSMDYYGHQRPNPVDEFIDMGAVESPFGQVSLNISDLIAPLPLQFALRQNYPNPFNPSTNITYQLPLTSNVELSIYSILGQKVAMLVSEKQNPGYHQVQWDASGFASGVYYYMIKAGDFQDVKKLILLR